MRRKSKKKGFTLVELIVVIAILGILAVIAVPKLGGFRENAGIAADKATAETMKSAITMLVANGTITPDTTDKTITFTGGTTNTFSANDAEIKTLLNDNPKLVKATSIAFTIKQNGAVTYAITNPS